MSTDVTLADDDSAIIFHEDGTLDLAIPNKEGEEFVNQSSLAALRCTLFIRNPEMVAEIDKQLDAINKGGKDVVH